MKHFITKLRIVQFIKFGIVGLSNTFLSYIIYAACVLAGMHYFVGSILGFIASVLNSFFWNNRYVFQKGNQGEKWLVTLGKTFVAYAGTGLVLTNILLFVEIDIFHLPELAAPIVNLVITVPLNFLLNKLWAFKDRR